MSPKRTILAICLSGLTFLQCSETPEETILRLQKQMQEGKYEQTETEILELEHEISDESSVVLSEKNTARLYAVSLDHTAFTWYENGKLFYRTLGITKELSLPDAPVRLLLSYSGKTALAEYHDRPGSDGNCSYDYIHIIQGKVHPDILSTNCENTPAITDTGDRIYYSDGKALYFKDTEKDGSALAAPASVFKEKFKKVENRFHIASLPNGAIWIFYGEAGYYNLYYYSGKGQPTVFMEGVASPILYGSVQRDFLKDDTEKINPESLFAGDPAVFLYTGAAGNYKLQMIHLPDRKGPIFDVGIREDMFYVAEKEQFLLVRNDHLSYLNPTNRKYSRLPMEASRIFVYSEGIAYVNPKGKLLLRSRGFSNFEKKLFELKEELASEGR
ncbi:MAG: hypothetical protein KDK37_14920 [Leptospiraceae bacterium]|nr:hypothetical protein [Leptospiraceae bacterium]